MEISRLQAQANDAERNWLGSPRKLLQPKLQPWPSTSLRLSLNRFGMTALTMVSAHSFTMFGMSTRNGTCLSLGRQPRRWSLSSMHLQRRFLDDPSTEFMPPTDQSPEVADRPPQVINEDSTTVTADSDGVADEDDEVMEVDNPAAVLSSD